MNRYMRYIYCENSDIFKTVDLEIEEFSKE